ncbi:Rap1a/Tai family immunity protein [Rhodovarius sp.]|uniref:Rap1a/Tai family immunity protein n=1 Tax=Rhodovarius sp. TaxID=2972673 RepID=UPI003340F6B4
MLKTIIIAAGAVLATTPAIAQPQHNPGPARNNAEHVTHAQSVADLATICDPQITGVPRLESIAYCQGFLTGAGQYHALLHPSGGRSRSSFCMPSPGPSVAETGIGFARWARENPQYAHEAALDGLLRWQQANFPCPAEGHARPPRHPR